MTGDVTMSVLTFTEYGSGSVHPFSMPETLLSPDSGQVRCVVGLCSPRQCSNFSVTSIVGAILDREENWDRPWSTYSSRGTWRRTRYLRMSGQDTLRVFGRGGVSRGVVKGKRGLGVSWTSVLQYKLKTKIKYSYIVRLCPFTPNVCSKYRSFGRGKQCYLFINLSLLKDCPRFSKGRVSLHLRPSLSLCQSDFGDDSKRSSPFDFNVIIYCCRGCYCFCYNTVSVFWLLCYVNLLEDLLEYHVSLVTTNRTRCFPDGTHQVKGSDPRRRPQR